MFRYRLKKKPQNKSDCENTILDQNPKSVKRENYPDDNQAPEKMPTVTIVTRDIRQVLRGSKLRFTEDIAYNVSQLQKFVPSPELVTETIYLGSFGPKEVVLIYIRNIAKSDIVNDVRQRLERTQARTLYESSYIQRNIEDSCLSPFPQIEATERPDVAMSALWQGRVAIILDGSPQVLLAPCTFFDLMDTPDDAYTRWYFAASFFRIARYIMLLLAVCLPGFYIALLSFNPEMIPTRLLLLILNSREGTPFPVYFEIFLMMGIAEAVRMMLIRIPTQVGAAVALFAGITLVIAGLFSHIIGSVVVLIVTLTIISSFGIPDNDLRTSIRIVQFFTMAVSSCFGLFGFALSLLCNLHSPGQFKVIWPPLYGAAGNLGSKRLGTYYSQRKYQ